MQRMRCAGTLTDTRMLYLVCVCACTGHMECVRVLLGAQANLISADSNGASPLHLAVLNGHRECAALLIEKGSLVNAQDDR